MPNCNDQNNQLLVSYLAKDTVISHAVTPYPSKVRLQRFTQFAWVSSLHDSGI